MALISSKKQNLTTTRINYCEDGSFELSQNDSAQNDQIKRRRAVPDYLNKQEIAFVFF